jgi:hypothetical protein
MKKVITLRLEEWQVSELNRVKAWLGEATYSKAFTHGISMLIQKTKENKELKRRLELREEQLREMIKVSACAGCSRDCLAAVVVGGLSGTDADEE